MTALTEKQRHILTEAMSSIERPKSLSDARKQVFLQVTRMINKDRVRQRYQLGEEGTQVWAMLHRNMLDKEILSFYDTGIR